MTLTRVGARRAAAMAVMLLLVGCQALFPQLPPSTPGSRTPARDTAQAAQSGATRQDPANRPRSGVPAPLVTHQAQLPLPKAPPQGAILGAGDVVIISVQGQPELGATVDVGGNGRISVPLAGSVEVAGLSTADAAERVAQALRSGGIVLNPQVTVAIKEARSQQVSVLGEVQKPGRFRVDARLTVLDVLALAGGITAEGGSVVYVLRRGGDQTQRYAVDLEALTGANFEAIELQAGDTVVVPKAELFYIYGEVKAPNAYRLRPGMTVIQALSVAGGLTDRGSDQRVEIRRRNPAGNLATLAAGLSDLVQPDDIIYVKERFF